MGKRFLIAVLLQLLALTTPAISTQDQSIFDQQKVLRYLDLKMYREAREYLEPALKRDEFNPTLRFMYGVAMGGLKQYDDAIRELEIAVRIGPVTPYMLNSLMTFKADKFAQSGGNENRLAVFNAATQVMEFRGNTLSDEGRNDLAKIRNAAAGLIAELGSPIGLWRSGRNEYQVEMSGGRLWLIRPRGQPLLSIELEKTGLSDFKGTGLVGNGLCSFDGDVAVHVSNGGAEISIHVVEKRLRGPDIGVESKADEQLVMAKICTETVPKTGMKTYDIVATRTAE